MSVFQLYDEDSNILPYGMIRNHLRNDTNQTTTGGFIPLFEIYLVSSANTVRHIAFEKRNTQYCS
jgi:hypothetical protein